MKKKRIRKIKAWAVTVREDGAMCWQWDRNSRSFQYLVFSSRPGALEKANTETHKVIPVEVRYGQ